MKNGQLVTAYLDYCEARHRRWDVIKDDLELIEDLAGGSRLYQAALDDGWTFGDIDSAYERRFDLPAGTIAQMRVRNRS